jgi:hypothetical protein
MDYATQLELDLSALEIDDFDVVDSDLSLEVLTAEDPGRCYRCGFCGCPCICAT